MDIRLALNKAKKYKALGDDSIPIETLCNDKAIGFLYELHNQTCDNSMVPGEWRRGIVAPIPKCCASDPRVPLDYREVTLSSHLYKRYCSTSNDRLIWWVEGNNVVCNEQNGLLRPGPYCLYAIDQLNLSARIKLLWFENKIVTMFAYMQMILCWWTNLQTNCRHC